MVVVVLLMVSRVVTVMEVVVGGLWDIIGGDVVTVGFKLKFENLF